MVYYLQMDGVDDTLLTPPITFDEIQIDFSAVVGAWKKYIDFPGGRFERFITDYEQYNGGFSSILKNGVVQTNLTKFVNDNERMTIKALTSSVFTQPVNFFSSTTPNDFLQGKIYSIKLLNAGVTVAYYDMSTKTVLDQSGNGNHATLTGGTWVDEVVGGTVGSSIYDIRNQIYSISLFNFDSKQFLYQTSSQPYDSRIEQYKTDLLNYDNKQMIYNSTSSNFDIKNEIYNVASVTYNTRQIIFETLNIMYDTLQQIFDGGLIGSTKFDTLLTLYANDVKLYDTKQSYYQTSVNEFDLKHEMYKVDQLNGDTRFSIYKNASSNMDLKQSIYSNDTKPFDTKQSMFTNNFIDFSVRNEIFKQQSNSFDAKQIISKLDTAEFNLKQAMYKSSGTDYDTLQQMLSDFQVYRQVIQYILNINTKNNYNLEIALRKKFNMKL